MNTEAHTGPYQRYIIQHLGCTPQDAAMVEDIMRRFVFHSTLDWQSDKQFRKGVLEAWEMLESDRPMFEEFYAAARRCSEEMRMNRKPDTAVG
jgi:hypothetical protein